MNKINYFIATFSSLNSFFAAMKTTKAIIIKYIRSERNAPQDISIEPIINFAVFYPPPGIKCVIIGIKMLSTSDFMSVVAAALIIKAIARPITLYSLKNSINYLIKPIQITCIIL